VPLRRLAGAQGSAKLRAVLSLERAASDSRKAQVLVDGRIGALRANVVVTAESKSGDFTGIDLAAFADANIALGVQFVADEGAALLAALGLDRIPAAAGRAGRLVLSARGPLGEALRFDGKLVAGSIDAEGEGVLRMSAERPAAIALDGFSGSVGGHKVSGKLSVQLGDAARLEGEIDAETLDAAATVAAAAGAPAGTGTRDTEGWPQDPFAAPRSDLSGRIAFKARRATLAGNMTAEMLQGVARFSRGEVVFENVHGVLGNGRFEAELELTGEAGGLAARARVALHDAEAAALFGDADPPPIAGKLRFQAEVAGSGRSPAAFIGSLSGNGSVTLDNGRLAGLNPEVFEAAIRAAEIGAPIDGPRVNAFASGMLASGSLAVPRAQASIGISSGLARIAEVSAPQADGFEANGFLDLASGTIDAQVTLTGRTALANGARPALQVAIRGAVSSPLRAVDATPFANWLTMRAVEQQAKQLEAIERENRARESREKEMREKEKFDRESRERDAPGVLPPRTEVPEAAPEIRQASEQAPPLPPPVSVPAGPRIGRTPAARPAPDPRPDTAIRPPGLIGAQH
jgi:hypothetical protein